MKFSYLYLCHSEPGSRHCYKQFPSTVRTEEQEEKRRSILALASGAHSGRQNPRYKVILIFLYIYKLILQNNVLPITIQNLGKEML